MDRTRIISRHVQTLCNEAEAIKAKPVDRRTASEQSLLELEEIRAESEKRSAHRRNHPELYPKATPAMIEAIECQAKADKTATTFQPDEVAKETLPHVLEVLRESFERRLANTEWLDSMRGFLEMNGGSKEKAYSIVSPVLDRIKEDFEYSLLGLVNDNSDKDVTDMLVRSDALDERRNESLHQECLHLDVDRMSDLYEQQKIAKIKQCVRANPRKVLWELVKYPFRNIFRKSRPSDSGWTCD